MKYFETNKWKNNKNAIWEIIAIAFSSIAVIYLSYYFDGVKITILTTTLTIILLLLSAQKMTKEYNGKIDLSTFTLILVCSVSSHLSICGLAVYSSNIAVQIFSVSLILLFFGLAIFALTPYGRRVVKI